VIVVLAWVLQRWPGERWWPSILLVYGPQVVWLVLPVVALLGAGFAQDGRAAVLALLVLLAVIFGLMGFRVPFPAQARGSPRLVVATWNTHNQRDLVPQMKAELDRVRPDVVCLQEAAGFSLRSAFGGWGICSTEHYQDILARQGLKPGPLVPLQGSWRSACAAQIALGGREVDLLCVHLTPAAGPRSLSRSRHRQAYLHHTVEGRTPQI
jgi:endonuclease/exonuclease/phosphatase (EEP) superfamily protein YafD